MQATQRKTLSTMSVADMLSLWYRERWVRYLVISIAPIGLIDATYTIMLWNSFGGEYEFNPLVKLALSSEWWFVWFVVDIVSFLIFAMIAGSYYLHTRSRIFGSQTWWLAALIAFRVGAATYNIMLFYSLFFPFGVALLSFILSLLVFGRLLSRTEDMSQRGARDYLRWKYYRLKDHMATRGVKPSGGAVERTEETPPPPAPKDGFSLWLKRAGLISAAILFFVSLPFFIAALVDFANFGAFNEIFDGLIIWNQQSGSMFVASFLSIIFFTGFMIYFILRAFGAGEEAW